MIPVLRRLHLDGVSSVSLARTRMKKMTNPALVTVSPLQKFRKRMCHFALKTQAKKVSRTLQSLHEEHDWQGTGWEGSGRGTSPLQWSHLVYTPSQRLPPAEMGQNPCLFRCQSYRSSLLLSQRTHFFHLWRGRIVPSNVCKSWPPKAPQIPLVERWRYRQKADRVQNDSLPRWANFALKRTARVVWQRTSQICHGRFLCGWRNEISPFCHLSLIPNRKYQESAC